MTNNTMTQEMPAEVKNIITNYETKMLKHGLFNDSLEQLAVSLYAARKGAEASKDVMEILADRLFALSDFFTEQEQQLLNDNYAAVVELCFDAYNKSIIDLHSGMSAQPKELTNFLAQFMAPALEEGSEVYLPFAGLCSDALAMKGYHIDGEEISPKAWALAQIRLDAHGIDADIRLADSCLSLMQEDGKRYSTIMFVPPFRLRFGGEKRRLTEYDAVRLAFDNKLKDGGLMCCVLPAAFTTGVRRAMRLRKSIVENGYLRAVIAMPDIFSPLTQTRTVVLVLEKRKGENFYMVDGRSFSVRNRINETRVLENVALYDAIINEKEQVCKILSMADLDESFSLSPIRYLQDMSKIQLGDKMYTLQDIVANVGKRIGRDSDCAASEQALVIPTLSDNYNNCDVRILAKNDKSPLPPCNLYLYEVDAPCIVVQPSLRKIRVGELSGKGKCMVRASKEVCFLRPKNDIVVDKYLLRALTSDSVRRQVEAKNYGSGKRQITKTDMMSLVIPVPFKDDTPNLEKQNQILLEDLRLSVSEGERRLAHELEEYKKDVHIKKHAIGQILFGLNVNMMRLQKFRDKGVFDVCKANGGEAIDDLLENIRRQVKAVSNAIQNFTVGEDSTYKEEAFALVPFFEDFCAGHENDVYDIWYQRCDDDYAKEDRRVVLEDENGVPCRVSATNLQIKKGDPIKYVSFSKKALEEIMENICVNAMEYGFKGRKDGNLIRISIETTDGCYVVSVANNGCALNSDTNVEDVFKYGVTTSDNRDKHSGIGGYQIKKLMERFGGSVELVSQPDNDFPVVYRMTFKYTNALSLLSLQ